MIQTEHLRASRCKQISLHVNNVNWQVMSALINVKPVSPRLLRSFCDVFWFYFLISGVSLLRQLADT